LIVIIHVVMLNPLRRFITEVKLEAITSKITRFGCGQIRLERSLWSTQ
jgi:hypothetical protein